MNMNRITERYSKSTITQFFVDAMKDDPEIREIIVFGSFLCSENPEDIDVAVILSQSDIHAHIAEDDIELIDICLSGIHWAAHCQIPSQITRYANDVWALPNA